MNQRKSSKDRIIANLVERGTMPTTELAEAVGVTEKNFFDALRALEKAGIISWEKGAGGRPGWVGLKTRARNAATGITTGLATGLATPLDTANLHLVRTGASFFPGPKNPGNITYNTLSFYSLLNHLAESVSPPEKRDPPPVVCGPEGIAAAVSKESSSCRYAKSLPVERPEEIDDTFKNNRYRAFLTSSGLAKKKYRVSPNDDLNLSDWEPIVAASEKGCFCYCIGLDHPVARDLAFAEVWVEQYLTNTKHRKDDGLVDLIRYPSPRAMEKSKIWQAVRRARVWADFRRAKYQDWCRSIFEFYRDHPLVVRRGSKRVPVAITPFLFSGPAARDVYENFWGQVARIDRIRREEIEKLDPDFCPENYRPENLRQRRYFTGVLLEIERLADAQCRPVEQVVSEYIYRRILPQTFAEDQNLNTVCPGFRYEKRVSRILACIKL